MTLDTTATTAEVIVKAKRGRPAGAKTGTGPTSKAVRQAAKLAREAVKADKIAETVKAELGEDVDNSPVVPVKVITWREYFGSEVFDDIVRTNMDRSALAISQRNNSAADKYLPGQPAWYPKIATLRAMPRHDGIYEDGDMCLGSIVSDVEYLTRAIARERAKNAKLAGKQSTKPVDAKPDMTTPMAHDYVPSFASADWVARNTA